VSKERKFYVFAVGVDKDGRQSMANAYMFENGIVTEKVIRGWQEKFSSWNEHWDVAIISFWKEIDNQ